MKKLVLCGVTAGMTAAMVMMTGCSSKDQKLAPPPGQAGILGNREIVPPPFDSPDDLKRLNRPGTAPRMDSQRHMNVLPPEPTLAVDGPGAVMPLAPAPTMASLPSGGAYSGAQGPNAQQGAGKLTSVVPVADLNTGNMTGMVPPPDANDANGVVSPMFTDMKNNGGRPQGVVDLNNPRQNPSPRPAGQRGTAAKPAATPHGSAATAAPAGKTYTVKANDTLIGIARHYGITWQELAALNGLSYQSRLKIGDVLALPAHAKATAGTAATTSKDTKSTASTGKATGTTKAPAAPVSSVKKPLPADGMYTVVDGDSLWKIAHKYGLKADDIRAWNNLKSDKLQIDQKLRLKAPEGFTPASAPAKADDTTKPADIKAPEASTNKKSELDPNMHIVVSGDSLWTIARKYKVTTKDLEKWNNLKNHNLRIGRALIVKAPAADGTVEDKPATPATAAAPAADAAKTAAAPKPAPAAPVVPDKIPLKVSVSMNGNNTNELVNVRDDNGVKLGGANVVNLNALQAVSTAKPAANVYIVKAEDTFVSLKNAYGWTPEKLKELNPHLKDQDELKAGMEIKVPIDER